MANGIGTLNNGAASSGGARTVYQNDGVREVQSRARFIEHDQTPQEQAGLKRLDRLLQHGGGFSAAAPRGFYLNIKV